MNSRAATHTRYSGARAFADTFITVHPQTARARKAALVMFSRLLGVCGRKWNRMDSGERRDLLFTEPQMQWSQAIDKFSLQRWQQLPRGTRGLVALLMLRAKRRSGRQ